MGSQERLKNIINKFIATHQVVSDRHLFSQISQDKYQDTNHKTSPFE